MRILFLTNTVRKLKCEFGGSCSIRQTASVQKPRGPSSFNAILSSYFLHFFFGQFRCLCKHNIEGDYR